MKAFVPSKLLVLSIMLRCIHHYGYTVKGVYYYATESQFTLLELTQKITCIPLVQRNRQYTH